MPKNSTVYNLIAGESAERLAALSDGIFGVAMTLLLLNLSLPAKDSIQGYGGLWPALVHTVGPDLVVYLMSFITLGIFWVGQQTLLTLLDRSDRHLTWLHLAFLFIVTLMPFSTRLLIAFITFRTALLAYWVNILLLGSLLYICWMRATKSNLVKNDVPPELCIAFRRRIIGGQLLYAFGAALCVINTYVSIAFIVLVQLNFAIAPRIRWLSKI